eukprot:TRINITY_DN5640_c0_g1_i3.p1 TRINITY_DN5640_c0_g1~~TRINITY_DN5640_c0_g1_i3.p1  ORF type:complete len:331 (+),score=137.95 TRINITY_DN5640_c0_g1_i3:3-995(+)
MTCNLLSIGRHSISKRSISFRSFSSLPLLLFSIVDLHSLTSVKMNGRDAKEEEERRMNIKEGSREMAIALLACGLDSKKCILFQQSHVPQHAELSWLLGCLTPNNWLESMIQFKTKKEDGTLNSLGLFGYPVLMAADILLYGATHVPVGEDQRQHIELTRDIAIQFNNYYKKDYFVPPTSIHTTFQRVMSLKEGRKKMSKSDPSDYTRINMNDSSDLIQSKIKKATTDSTKGVSIDKENRPEITNLVEIFASVTNKSTEMIVEEFKDSGHAAFKSALTVALQERLGPIREKMDSLRANPSLVDSILEEGAETARRIAINRMKEIREIAGY